MSAPEDSRVGDTRGSILSLLCSSGRTASELGSELGITANGARGHLTRLEQEGLVERRVVRRGVGKPAHEYHLTAEGSLRLSRAYLPLLSAILSVVDARGGTEDEETLLREAGRTLVGQHARPGGAMRERADAAVDLLGQLGAIARVREDAGAFWIEGACCPLRALVPGHPLACKAVEAMLEEYLGASVCERCEKHDPPTCRLVIGATDR